jgi:hypothetical protein
MTHNQLSSLLSDMWGDLHDPSLLWQIVTLVACLAFGWVLARLLRARFVARGTQLLVVRLGVESFAGVLWPLLALTLIAIATPILAQWQRVNLLRVAIPLAASFALIRLAFYILRRAFARGGSAGSFLLFFEKTFAAVVCGSVLHFTSPACGRT